MMRFQVVFGRALCMGPSGCKMARVNSSNSQFGYMKIWIKALLTGVGIGIGVGLLVAVSITFMDWRFNPGEIFHGPGGTNWEIVGETAWSWFWPCALAAMPVAVLASAWLFGRKSS